MVTGVDPRMRAEAERLATYPAAYPEGWYVIGEVRQLRRRPQTLEVLGRHLHVSPRGTGFVVVDRGARVVALPTAELHGWLCVFHGRGTNRAPGYRPATLPEIDRGDLVRAGTYDAGRVAMHLSEFAENSVDFAHFAVLHGTPTVPWTQREIPGIALRHQAAWDLDAESPHVAWFSDEARLSVAGKTLEWTGATARIRLEGPGGIIRFDYDLRGHGRVVVFQTHTPRAPLDQHVRFFWFREPRVPRVIAWLIAGSWVSQWRRDVDIWSRKRRLATPALTPHDGPFGALRRWYDQFYPDLASTKAHETTDAVEC